MSEDSGPLRLFAAIELPDDWRAALGRVIAELRHAGGASFKWVEPDLMHVTLLFLGNQDAGSIPTIEAALEDAASTSRSFQLDVSQLGRFGPPHALAVVWAGLDGPPQELQALHRSIAQQLATRKIPFDNKPLVPHITLARGRRPVDREASIRLSAAMQRTGIPRMSWTADSFVLMRSRLSPRGPSYEVLRKFPLGESDDR